jgi:dienelactone hydrolase
MTEVILFHHAQGLTTGVREFAARLESAGHTVRLPDLYDGRTFADLESGIGYAQQIGFGAVTERGLAAAGQYPAEVVYVGISLGVLAAQPLAQKRPGAKGAILLESCIPPAEFGGPWPAEVPVQVHGMDDDPIFAGEGDLDAARELVASVPDGELFLYPGKQHLFADHSLATYDAGAAELLTERVLRFLARVS